MGSPPLVGASFGMPTSSVGPRVSPSLIPLTPSHSPCSLSPPLTPTLLCLAPLLLSLASNDTMFCGAHHLFLLCFAVPTTSLLCFAVATTYLGPRVLPISLTLLPACSLSLPSHSLSLPLPLSCSPCSSLTLLLLPSLPLAPNGQTRVVVYYTIFRGPHHLCGGKGQDGSERE